jgi:hypothetical protein
MPGTFDATSKSKMILRRLGGGDEAYYIRVTFRLYVEEADNDANKNSALIYNWTNINLNMIQSREIKRGVQAPFIMLPAVIIITNMPLLIFRWIPRFRRCHQLLL